MEETSRRGILGRHQSCYRERLKFYQTRSNAIILQETLPAYCIPKVVRLKTGEVLYDKVYMSPRPPPKISLKHEWKRELGSKVARQPEGEVARLANFSNRGDLMTFKMEETRPVLRRSMLILSTKNSVLQTERGDLLRDAFRENPFIRRV